VKANKKLTFGLLALASAITMAIFGAVAGTLAWYAYSRTVTFSYIGTSISNSSLLNVGLIDDSYFFTNDDLRDYGLIRENVDEGGGVQHSIVFSQSRNGFSVEALHKYLGESDYAIDKLIPVTTNARAINATSDLTLYKAPEFSDTTLNHLATHNEYVQLPFAFKVIGDSDQLVHNKDVWLTDSLVQAERDIQNSVRVFVNGSNKFLFKPADITNSVGETKVGGLLDLDGDGYYDVNSSNNTEYIYGLFNNSPTISTEGYPEGESYDVLKNINGVEDTSANSTFLAKHYPTVKYVDSFTGADPQVAAYYNFGKVKPNLDGDGNFVADANGGIAIARTSSTTGIAYSTFTIFIEGWDHSVIDSAVGYDFNLSLRFEVDRS